MKRESREDELFGWQEGVQTVLWSVLPAKTIELIFLIRQRLMVDGRNHGALEDILMLLDRYPFEGRGVSHNFRDYDP
ncbi:unnamed protein product [Camellia sinensis]